MLKLKWILPVVASVAIAVSGYLYLRDTSPLFNLFFSPTDLYENLYQGELKLDENESHEFKVRAEYPGNYALFITVDNAIPIGEKYDIRFLLHLEIKNENGEVIISKAVSKPVYKYWSKHPTGGLAIAAFDVPEDFTLENELSVSVVITEGDYDFEKRHGPLNLAFRKYSDK